MDILTLRNELASFGQVFTKKFDANALENPEKTFFYYGETDKAYSYKEINELSNSFANALLSMGINREDRVCLFLKNPVVFTIAMMGIWKTGAVFCPINSNYKGRLLADILKDLNPKILVTEQGAVQAIHTVRKILKDVFLILYKPQKTDHDYGERQTSWSVKKSGLNSTLFSELLNEKKSDPGVNLSGEDTASIIYTAGTTGMPKGVIQQHSYLQACLLPLLMLTHPDDIIYTDLPMYHPGGTFLNVVRAGWAGSQVALWDRFSPDQFWKRIKKCQATTTNWLDIMIPWLMMKKEHPSDKYNSLKTVGMHPLPENHHEVAQRFGIDLVTVGYGSTETGCVFGALIEESQDQPGTSSVGKSGYSKSELKQIARRMDIPVVPGWEDIHPGFVGSPLPMVEVSLANRKGERVTTGQPGHVLVKGRLPGITMKTYFNKSETDSGILRKGWVHSGDVMAWDESGYFYFIDRLDGVLLNGTGSLFCSEVEDLVLEHPDIKECTVFTIPATDGIQQEIAMFAVSEPRACLNEKTLKTWIRNHLPKYMRPAHIRLSIALPKNHNFNVQKYLLKEKLTKELGRSAL